MGLDTIEQVMRERVRATIEAIMKEELEAALDASRATGAVVATPYPTVYRAQAAQSAQSCACPSPRRSRGGLPPEGAWEESGGSGEGAAEFSVVIWLFGLLHRGQIRLQRFDGWKETPVASLSIQKQTAQRINLRGALPWPRR